MTDHTPTPWHVSEDGKLMTSEMWSGSTKGEFRGVPIASPWVEGAYDGDPIAKANAEFIARAVNAYSGIIAVRNQYANQAKFADVEQASYFREFVRRIDAALNA